jgi:hypothetical protein
LVWRPPERNKGTSCQELRGPLCFAQEIS